MNSKELDRTYSSDNGYSLNAVTLQQLHPYQAVINSNDGSKVSIKFDEMLFAVGHTVVKGTYFHKRELERLTNALFQTWSTEVYKRTAKYI